MKHRSLTMALALMLPASAALAQVDFVEPKNGDTVSSTFTVRFAVDGMSVAPAGELKEGTGHHHLLINTADIDENAVIPMDDQHKHFGKGQTETQLTLPPGKYILLCNLPGHYKAGMYHAFVVTP